MEYAETLPDLFFEDLPDALVNGARPRAWRAARARPRPGEWDIDRFAHPRRTSAEDDDAIAQQDRFLDIVRDVDDCLPVIVPDAQQLLLQDEARLGIERAVWLVEKEDLRIGDEGARDADALPHAHRELVRFEIEKVSETDLHDEVARALDCRVARDLLKAEAEGDVLQNVAPRQESVVLKNERRA